MRVSWTPDSKKVVYQAQNREQTFLDLNFAASDDGKSTTVLHETSKAWVEVIDNPAVAERRFVSLAKRAQRLAHLYHYGAGRQTDYARSPTANGKCAQSMASMKTRGLFISAPPNTATSRRRNIE